MSRSVKLTASERDCKRVDCDRDECHRERKAGGLYCNNRANTAIGQRKPHRSGMSRQACRQPSSMRPRPNLGQTPTRLQQMWPVLICPSLMFVQVIRDVAETSKVQCNVCCYPIVYTTYYTQVITRRHPSLQSRNALTCRIPLSHRPSRHQISRSRGVSRSTYSPAAAHRDQMPSLALLAPHFLFRGPAVVYSNRSVTRHSSTAPPNTDTHINTYQHSSYSSLPTLSRPTHHGNASPESRPTTGYSVSSMSSMSTPYDDTASHPFHDYSRPGSSHRPLTPASSRPPSSKASSYAAPNLSVRRDRRHSHAMSPYPSPYAEHPSSERPSTSPHPGEDHAGNSGIPRVRSMMGMSSVSDAYGFNPAQADFAYGAVDDHHSGGHSQNSHGMYARTVRPSTSASSLSGSSSAANTPGADGYGQAGPGENVDISRCE